MVGCSRALLSADRLPNPKAAAKTISGRQCASLSFACNAKDPVNGKQLIVSWSRDSRLVQSNQRIRLSGSGHERITFSPLLKQDEGMYVCGAATDLGMVAVSGVNVRVQGMQQTKTVFRVNISTR